MDSISNEVKDHDKIPESPQLLNDDKDYFPSSPDGQIDPSEKVMSQYEVPLLDEMNDSPRTSESDDEAHATDDYIEAELEKIGNMTLEEIDAAADEAYEESYVAEKEAAEANTKSKKALEHLRAITKASEKDSFMELKWIGSHQTLREATEAVKAAIEECYAASRELRSANQKAGRFKRLIEAICKARDKRPKTDCESGGASCSY